RNINGLGSQNGRRRVAQELQPGSTRHVEMQPRSRDPGLGVSQRMGKRSRLYVISDYPCGVGLPCSSIETNTISSMVKISCRVIILRTSARIVNDVRPKRVAFSPISIMSPCTAEDTKLISDIILVTAR